MILPAQTAPSQSALTPDPQPVRSNPDEATQLRLRFEQMLWSEMLSHAGLEKAFTQGGGEGASAFSRFVVEAIAKDLAEKHPLGLGDKALAGPLAAAAATHEGTETE